MTGPQVLELIHRSLEIWDNLSYFIYWRNSGIDHHTLYPLRFLNRSNWKKLECSPICQFLTFKTIWSSPFKKSFKGEILYELPDPPKKWRRCKKNSISKIMEAGLFYCRYPHWIVQNRGWCHESIYASTTWVREIGWPNNLISEHI